MARQVWSESVETAIHRYCRRTGLMVFDEDTFISAELASIVAETGSLASDPRRTVVRQLRRLCDVGVLELERLGSYRLRDPNFLSSLNVGAKGVFVLSVDAAMKDDPTETYRFDSIYLDDVKKLVGSAIIYQLGPNRYYAAAKVASIAPASSSELEFQAIIEPGSFIEFGEHVPLEKDGRLFERGLQYPNGRRATARNLRPVRFISDDDFFSVLDFVEQNTVDTFEPDLGKAEYKLFEERAPYYASMDRERLLNNRIARDQQFRKRVLRIYKHTCAVSGLTLVDPSGNAEVQAAHIRSVARSGPDSLTNGMALAATVHWAYDRGLISFGDGGEILLSSHINDPEFVRRFIPHHRHAGFAEHPLCRPSPRHLQWHRENCFRP